MDCWKFLGDVLAPASMLPSINRLHASHNRSRNLDGCVTNLFSNRQCYSSLRFSKKEHDTKQARDPCGILCRTRSYLARNWSYEDFKLFVLWLCSWCNEYKYKIDKLTVFSFLAGLIQEYDQIRSQILGRSPSYSNASLCYGSECTMQKKCYGFW